MIKGLGVAPASGPDLAPKAYVDARTFGPYTPRAAGDFQHPSNFSGSTGTSAANAGALYLTPFDIGPNADTFDAMGVACTALASGGATLVYRVGLYADDGSGGMPDWTRLLVQTTLTITATGNVWGALALSLQPGRYWGAFLYTAATAPSPAATFTCLAGSIPLWVASGGAIGSQARSLYLTGQSALPTTSPQSGLTTQFGATCPVLALRAS